MRGCIALLLALTSAGLAAGADQDARQIVLESLAVDNRTDQAIQNYTYKTRTEARTLDKTGSVKQTTSNLAETIYIGGRPYRKTLEKDGKPLSPKDAAAEQQKLDRAVSDAGRLSAAARAKNQQETEKNHATRRRQMNAVPDAFTFRLAGETMRNGRETYQIIAQPRADYRGEFAGLFRNMTGTLWIDKKDHQWVKVEASTVGTISFGLFLARIAPGSTLAFESAKINDELWAPSSVEVTAAARFLLVKGLNEDIRLDFSDYRRFSTDSRILSTEADTDR